MALGSGRRAETERSAGGKPAADFIDRVVNGFALREGPDLGGFVGVELPHPTADPSPESSNQHSHQ